MQIKRYICYVCVFGLFQLIPLFVFIGGGATMSMLYLCRLALKNPDCS